MEDQDHVVKMEVLDLLEALDHLEEKVYLEDLEQRAPLDLPDLADYQDLVVNVEDQDQEERMVHVDLPELLDQEVVLECLVSLEVLGLQGQLDRQDKGVLVVPGVLQEDKVLQAGLVCRDHRVDRVYQETLEQESWH